ncbi:hypothetical protein BDW62DRAFT_159132 [Aspergillus aurantiobrunneus]
MFNSDDLATLIPRYNEGYRALTAEGLPAPLNLIQVVLPMPKPTFAALFSWTSTDLEAGKGWLDKVCSLGPVVGKTVQESTPKGWLDEVSKLIAPSTQGRLYTISLREITDEVAHVIAHYVQKMPSDPHILFDMHELLGNSPSARPNPDSVFSAREGHFAFEIVPLVEKRENLDGALVWGREPQEALQRTDADNIVPASYLSFVSAEEMDPSKAFGEYLPFPKDLKRRVDPQNVFRAISYL